MPSKPLEESTGLENYMLYKAAKLLAAVRWVAENPPMPEKENYLNKIVLEEIGSTTLSSGDTDTLQEPDNPSAPAAKVDASPLSAPSPVRLLTQAAKK
ncbi:hypothetical protein V8E53_002396, partial [Lactarius tabidus]